MGLWPTVDGEGLNTTKSVTCTGRPRDDSWREGNKRRGDNGGQTETSIQRCMAREGGHAWRISLFSQ